MARYGVDAVFNQGRMNKNPSILKLGHFFLRLGSCKEVAFDAKFSIHDPIKVQLSGKERLPRKSVRHQNLELPVAVSEVKDIIFSKTEKKESSWFVIFDGDERERRIYTLV